MLITHLRGHRALSLLCGRGPGSIDVELQGLTRCPSSYKGGFLRMSCLALRRWRHTVYFYIRLATEPSLTWNPALLHRMDTGHNAMLEELTLEGNPLGSEGAEALVDCLAERAGDGGADGGGGARNALRKVGLRRCGIERVTCWGLLQLVHEAVELLLDWDWDELEEELGEREKGGEVEMAEVEEFQSFPNDFGPYGDPRPSWTAQLP